MNSKPNEIEALIAGGLIGAALGAILSKDKEDGALLGAILGAAVSATLSANERAKKSDVPLYVEENGMLYEIKPGGEKRFVKKITKPPGDLPERFKLI